MEEEGITLQQREEGIIDTKQVSLPPPNLRCRITLLLRPLRIQLREAQGQRFARHQRAGLRA